MTRLLSWGRGLEAIQRDGDGLVVDKARGKAPFLTHFGSEKWTKALWFDVALAIEHYEQKGRQTLVERLRAADLKDGVDQDQKARNHRGAHRLILAGALLQCKSQVAGYERTAIQTAPGESYPRAVLRAIDAMPEDRRARLKELVDWVEEYVAAGAKVSEVTA